MKRRSALLDDVFISNYNKGDSKALTALFTEDAEVVEADGDRYQGRGLIEQSFTDTFAARQGVKIAFEIEGIRFLSPDVAKEEGRSLITPAKGAPESRLYTVLFVKREGRWLISSVREEPDPLVRPHDRLKDLEWMVGDWIDEGADSVVRLHCQWSEDENFLIRTFTVKRQGKPVMTVTQRIGWDPVARQVRSWEFDSEGGFGEGKWSRDGERWVVKSTGVRPEGTTASATNVMVQERPDLVRWVLDRPGHRRRVRARRCSLCTGPRPAAAQGRGDFDDFVPEHDKEPAMNRKMMTAVICASLVVALAGGMAFGRGGGGFRGGLAVAASMGATAAFMGVTEVCITAGCPRSAGLRRSAHTTEAATARLWKSRGRTKACTGASSTTVPARVPTTRRGAGPSTTAPREPPAEALVARRPAGVSTESLARRPAAGPTRMSVVPAGPSDLAATRSPGVRTSGLSRAAWDRCRRFARIRRCRVRRSLRRRVLRRQRVPAQRVQRLRRVSPGLGPRLLEWTRQRGLGMAQPLLGGRGPGEWGLGMGLGWGLSSWGFGSSLYGMGYMPYSNRPQHASCLPIIT